MPDSDEAEKAITALNGNSVNGRVLKVKRHGHFRINITNNRSRDFRLSASVLPADSHYPEIRRARAAQRLGKLSRLDYEAMLRAETERSIGFQEEIGLDVLVHGEFERNDWSTSASN
jgi:hypothetical protein